MHDLSDDMVTMSDLLPSVATLPSAASRTGYFQWLFETAHDGILILDADTGVILDANAVLLDVLGYTLDDIVERTLWEICPDDETASIRRTFTRMQRADRARYSDLLLAARDGRPVDVEFTSNAYRVDERLVIQCNIRDVSEQRKIERLAAEQGAALARSHAEKADLARSNAELEQFSYVASHDLREPLRAVSGCVQLLRQRYAGQLDEGADELIAHAVEGTRRMEALICDLLEFSRVGTQRQPAVSVDCKALLQCVLSDLSGSIAECGAVISIEPLPVVTADPLQMAQLFQNLLGNALKFHSDRRPTIRISATHCQDEWTFSIEDNGIGIAERQYARIFRVFQRLHPRNRYPGTGIGLAICEKIVHRHGGRIWVESREGHGSIFRFTLPDAP